MTPCSDVNLAVLAGMIYTTLSFGTHQKSPPRRVPPVFTMCPSNARGIGQ
jgi:hypothetical protein